MSTEEGKQPDYAKEFTDDGFWAKVGGYAKTAGSEVVEKALWLYYSFQRPETPGWAKAAFVGALGYFISPIDAIPDIVPAVGYADDLGVLALAVTTVATQIDESVRALAKKKLQDWFGE
ncbi:YkvA family protein [Caldimonas taiwanensis]|uniref:YkvA family protein n=1 Tax=Caldimonas taiwanensis TaxID=307483 RepID=UPI000785A466|nr:YkvA family protein [Caldimonas taiwanensis]